jgi:hypothetical protein
MVTSFGFWQGSSAPVLPTGKELPCFVNLVFYQVLCIWSQSSDSKLQETDSVTGDREVLSDGTQPAPAAGPRCCWGLWGQGCGSWPVAASCSSHWPQMDGVGHFPSCHRRLQHTSTTTIPVSLIRACCHCRAFKPAPQQQSITQAADQQTQMHPNQTPRLQ